MHQMRIIKNHLQFTSLAEIQYESFCEPSDAFIVQVLSLSDLSQAGFPNKSIRQSLRDFALVENTYLDILPSYSIGSFAVPHKDGISKEVVCFAFFFDDKRLLFVDEGTFCLEILKTIARLELIKKPSTGHCLLEFMKLLIKGDLAALASLEDHMEDIEEDIVGKNFDANSHCMLPLRRKLLRIDTYYQQLIDVEGMLIENENSLLSDEDVASFGNLERQTERLLERSLMLKEYSLQLRELSQSRLDTQQNETMRFFAVVTAIFAPLTLLTSWFGMNFRYMPIVNQSWGHPVIGVFAIALVIAEVIVFKRKNWL